MKLSSLHGYYKFFEDRVGEASEFGELYGFDLALMDGYYTYTFLRDAPRYSILGMEYLGVTATKTFEGEPWEVMRENGLVYDFTIDEVVKIEDVATKVKINSAKNYYFADGMILSGSVTDDGTRITDYAAHYSFKKGTFSYSGVKVE